jgi:hypothetical protein
MPFELSVVVPSVNGWEDLRGTLAALIQNADDVSLEVLVPDRCGDTVRTAVREHFPMVNVLPVPPGTTIPAMRAVAFECAQGESIAVIEDHVIVPPGWARAVLAARRAGDSVIGGAVVNGATDRLIDRAAFLCEYNQMLPPLTPGPSPWLTGNNTVYAREVLSRHGSSAAGRWEDRLHAVLRANGVPLVMHPEIVVTHKKHYSLGEYVSQRYLYARAFAADRVSTAGVARRLFIGAAAFLLPPILLARIVSRIWKSRTHRADLVPALPLLAVFVCAWAAGEVVGAWGGDGGALGRVC